MRFREKQNLWKVAHRRKSDCHRICSANGFFIFENEQSQITRFSLFSLISFTKLDRFFLPVRYVLQRDTIISSTIWSFYTFGRTCLVMFRRRNVFSSTSFPQFRDFLSGQKHVISSLRPCGGQIAGLKCGKTCKIA